jgi:spore maturation protein CgeB
LIIQIAPCKGFLLGLLSMGHEACFQEGREAEFFSSVGECADKIRYYLNHPVEREEIAKRGCERAKRSGYDNDTQLSRVLKKLDGPQTQTNSGGGNSSDL